MREEHKGYSVKSGEESGSATRFGKVAHRERGAVCCLNPCFCLM